MSVLLQESNNNNVDSQTISVLIEEEEVDEKLAAMESAQVSAFYANDKMRISSLRSIATEIIKEDVEQEDEETGNYVNIDHLRTQQAAVTSPSVSRASSTREDIFKRKRKVTQRKKQVDLNKWITLDPKNGFIRVFMPDNDKHSSLVNCTTDTTAMVICQKLNISRHSLHVQYSGGKIYRLDPFTCPLNLQNGYLATLGYVDQRRVQKVGTSIELSFLVKFFRGKPSHDFTFAKNALQGILQVKKNSLFAGWERHLCDCSGTRFQIYKGTTKSGSPTVIYLARGDVQPEKASREHEFKLKVSGLIQGGERSVTLSFKDNDELERWFRQLKKATSKLPSSTDLSNNHLETIPEPVFAYREIQSLNLRHNCLRSKNRAHQQGIKIGYIEDIAKFQHLTLLNLSDNNLSDLPLSICSLKSLVELNLSSNKLGELPKQISNLTKLEAVYVHNNHLSNLPESMVELSKLSMLVLAFNHFLEIPPILGAMAKFNENIVMSGNRISNINDKLAEQLKLTRRIDLRLNQICLNGTTCLNLPKFELLSHLDVRDNLIEELDLRNLRCLEYINCDRNRIISLKLNGTSLRSLMAESNKLSYIDINPKPEYLEYLNVSYNKLGKLPEYIGECFFLTQLHAAHNIITQLPPQLFMGVGKRLKVLRMNHNAIHSLPNDIQQCGLEVIQLQNNWINQLPDRFLSATCKLKILNLTKNRLVMLPPLNEVEDMNKVQELNLSFNFLENEAMQVIAGYKRLKLLRLSFNNISNIRDEDIRELKFLKELNISGNKLVSLPDCVLELENMNTLRAHSNMLREIPELQKMLQLRILDLGCNQLLGGSVKNLMESQLSLLDLSCNQKMGLSMQELSTIRSRRRICTVMAGENDALVSSKKVQNLPNRFSPVFPFMFGLAETSGIRNKLCISVIKKMPCPTPDSGIFAMFDGGYNNIVPRILQANFIRLFIEQSRLGPTDQQTMKYTMLACHRRLQQHGQKLGAASAAVYLKKKIVAGEDHWQIYVANVGDVEVVLSQRGKPIKLTRLFTATDRDEADRVGQTDGIITDDGKVNGCSKCTRMLGNSFMFPQVIPDPQVTHIELSCLDDCLIIANKNFWNFVSYEEAVEESRKHSHPVVAAKRLMDLAQAYGSQENVSILIIKCSMIEPENMNSLLRVGREIGHEIIEVESESDEYTKAHSITSSQVSLESESSEGWLKKRIDGYHKLRGQKTVEEVEEEVNGGIGQRMFVKRHEAEHLKNTLMQQRLSAEVKKHELEVDLLSLEAGDSDSNQNNWKTSKLHPHSKVSNYLSNTYKSMTTGQLPQRQVDELSEITNSDLVINPPRNDRIGDANIEPDTEEDNLDDEGDYDFLDDFVIEDVMDRPPTSVPWKRNNYGETHPLLADKAAANMLPSTSTIRSNHEKLKEDVYLVSPKPSERENGYSQDYEYAPINKPKQAVFKPPKVPEHKFIKGQPNASLSHHPNFSDNDVRFEDQEMIAEIRSQYSSVYSSLYGSVAQFTEDTAL